MGLPGKGVNLRQVRLSEPREEPTLVKHLLRPRRVEQESGRGLSGNTPAPGLESQQSGGAGYHGYRAGRHAACEGVPRRDDSRTGSSEKAPVSLLTPSSSCRDTVKNAAGSWRRVRGHMRNDDSGKQIYKSSRAATPRLKPGSECGGSKRTTG
ncbi:uncharacterized protein FYW61_013811 [Anableps anableps]